MFSRIATIRPWGSSLLIASFVILGSVTHELRGAEPPPAGPVLPADNPLVLEFTRYDANQDGLLNDAEYLTRARGGARAMRREFKVVDANRDERLDLNEFLTISVGQPEDQRGVIPDPVVLLAEAALNRLRLDWQKGDANGDDLLSSDEFKAAEFQQGIDGLAGTTFEQWDLDHNGQLSPEELRSVIEIAYGVRTSEGGPLRNKVGRVVDLRMFVNLKKDGDGFISRDEYFRGLGGLDQPEKDKWLETTDQNHDGKFDFAEFARSNHRTDPVATFLHLDTDLDGRLSPDELEKSSPDRAQLAMYVFPGFDDDRDGHLSLREYQLTPMENLLASWDAVRDADVDGQLSREEFRFYNGLSLAALTAEYFRRFDANQDDLLSLDEFPFRTTHRSAREWEIFVTTAEGIIARIALPDYQIICSPEISPDGKWVAADGWKLGQTNVAAHLLLASVDSETAKDLGMGCMPNWSSDGNRIAFCQYGAGVFIRGVNDPIGTEELIDRAGWAIQFSTDGRQTAYVQNGNLVIFDLETRQKRFVFPQGQSPYATIMHNLRWSPDSQQICFLGHRSNGAVEIAIVSVNGDPHLRVRCDGKAALPDFAWHADGKRILFPQNVPNQKSQIFEINLENDLLPIRIPGQPRHRNNGGLCLSRDGKTLVFVSSP